MLINNHLRLCKIISEGKIQNCFINIVSFILKEGINYVKWCWCNYKQHDLMWLQKYNEKTLSSRSERKGIINSFCYVIIELNKLPPNATFGQGGPHPKYIHIAYRHS